MMTSETRTSLLLIRHGQREHGEGRFYLHACPGLDAVGISQAEALAERLVRDATPTEIVILASQARRSHQTAEILAERLGVTVSAYTCDLCENHPGAAEGLTPSEMEQQFGRSYADVPGAEPFSEFLSRACASLERIVRTYRDRQILAVTHSGVIKASFVAFGKTPVPQATQLRPENTSITEWSSAAEIDMEGERVWSLERYNDVAHLHADVSDT